MNVLSRQAVIYTHGFHTCLGFCFYQDFCVKPGADGCESVSLNPPSSNPLMLGTFSSTLVGIETDPQSGLRLV